MSSWSVYLLQSLDQRHTYIGASNDPDRRLRQHNREISGGAKSTGKYAWRRVGLVTGFQDKIEALQFEWRWKHLTLTSPPGNPIERRMDALHRLFILFPRANELSYSENLGT
jgi:structure-specific endonuclease subunit SLX1